MKKNKRKIISLSTIALVLIAIVWLVGFRGKRSKEGTFGHRPGDSVITTATYVLPGTRDLLSNNVWKHYSKTVFVSVDTSDASNEKYNAEPMLDSFYVIPIANDTLKINGKPVLDTIQKVPLLLKPRMDVKWWKAPAVKVFDYNKILFN